MQASNRQLSPGVWKPMGSILKMYFKSAVSYHFYGYHPSPSHHNLLSEELPQQLFRLQVSLLKHLPCLSVWQPEESCQKPHQHVSLCNLLMNPTTLRVHATLYRDLRLYATWLLLLFEFPLLRETQCLCSKDIGLTNPRTCQEPSCLRALASGTLPPKPFPQIKLTLSPPSGLYPTVPSS